MGLSVPQGIGILTALVAQLWEGAAVGTVASSGTRRWNQMGWCWLVGFGAERA